MSSTHTRTLQAGFGLSVIILLASSVASYVSIRNLIDSSRKVNHTAEVLQKLENVISYTKDAETGQRGFLLTSDTIFLDPYKGSFAKTVATLDSIKRLTSDNVSQQQDVELLRKTLTERFDFLENSIHQKLVDVNGLRTGKGIMDRARTIVKRMQASEEQLLKQRTASQDSFSTFTPILIIVAALIAVFITVYFYRRVSRSFEENIQLNKELRAKDEEINNRINIIQGIAGKISKGDYKIRLNDAQADGLGSLAGSLNSMAGELDKSFSLLSDKDWLKTGVAALGDKVVGEQELASLSNKILDHLATYTNSQVGAFYLMDSDTSLSLVSGYAYKLKSKNDRFDLGEGIVGQAAITKREIIVNNIEDKNFLISFSSGEVKPASVIVIPILFENKIKGVIELGASHNYLDREIDFLKTVGENIGIALNTAMSRAKLQELLEETQAQTEELQAQHGELENLNTELEAQAEKLQASEEELKVQQEELTESNQELQQRSKLLEEKNDMVLIRNQEIQKKSEELALSAKYKSEFLANMSHELRTPLNSILLLSRLLGENNDKNLKDDQVEFAKVIQSSGNSLLLLIDDILDLSKIESGKMELEYENVALEDIVMDTKSIFEPLAREKKIGFAVTVEQGTVGMIETDKQRLEQVIKNLCSNAIKFTNTGLVEVIFSQSESNKDFMKIQVKDSGIGIAEDKQKLIFEAFQQADGSTRRKYGGTGLGLSISRQLTLLLKGEISLESKLDEGSVFTLLIPINKEVAKEVLQVLPAVVEEKIEEQELIEITPEKNKYEYLAGQIPNQVPDDRDNLVKGDKIMLIVEDDTGFAGALLDFTRKKGYKGLVAVRGDHGIEMARKYQPAGILLDIQLPIKSGWDVMNELKNDKTTKHIPVHIMSSLEVKKQSLMSGAIDFINKPVAFEHLDSIFKKIEFYLQKDSKKVLIIEDNSKHAEALAYFLTTHQVSSVISDSVEAGLNSLKKEEIDCVILDMGVPDNRAYEALERLKVDKGLENLPTIVFTGKSLSRNEEMRIRKYADSIVIKTAHSYRRILDEVSLFLHLVEENKKNAGVSLAKVKPLEEILKDKTVLIADDDVRNIFSLTRALEQHKMQIVPAIDGKEALESLEKKENIDIILMDMMMPQMDGYETIARIRKISKWRDVPIIAVTAKAMSGDREKCIEAGASDYISKPVDLDQLISLLRIWLYDTNAKRITK